MSDWIEFTKMHGAGNDFVVLDATAQELAAPQRDHDLAVDAIAQHRADCDRACSAATRQGLAGPALPGALLDAVSTLDLDELDVDPVGKGRVVLDRGPELCHRRGIDVLYLDDGVRVAHRDRRDLPVPCPHSEVDVEHRTFRFA